MCVVGRGGRDDKRTPRLWHLTSNSARDCVPLRCSYRQIPRGGGGGGGRVRSLKPWLYLFSADDPHSLVVMDTHSQVRTVVRPSPRSHAKQPSSAKVATILIPLLTYIDTSVVNSMERRKPVFDTSKWRGDGTRARVTFPNL